ncbi:MAG: Kdo hydroxylase family protein [Alphaproteobacteria bacterium]|nr:Kdo hydroxylase family protein [Alphaproteobacteria bacterium]MBV9061806.1 Kdo hydroxylase family protein [Alphaproteobacteria bacterium]
MPNALDFRASSTWIWYTNQVSHAAIGRQYLRERTFYVPVSAMANTAKSPLKILERLTRRALV